MDIDSVEQERNVLAVNQTALMIWVKSWITNCYLISYQLPSLLQLNNFSPGNKVMVIKSLVTQLSLELILRSRGRQNKKKLKAWSTAMAQPVETATDHRHIHKYLGLIMSRRALTDGQTDGRTDATKRIISLCFAVDNNVKLHKQTIRGSLWGEFGHHMGLISAHLQGKNY